MDITRSRFKSPIINTIYLLIILFFPVIGPILYFTFRRKLIVKERRKFQPNFNKNKWELSEYENLRWIEIIHNNIQRNLKNLFKILILTLILTSCKEKSETKMELEESNFNLETDYADFLVKMTESDTLKVWMDFSVCMYFANEKLTISKKRDTIKIESEFEDTTFSDEEIIRKSVFKISENDTLWKFGEFLSKNINRTVKPKDTLLIENRFGRLQIKCNTSNIRFFAKGLGDINILIKDYCNTMRNLAPENENYIFGIDIPVVDDDGNIIEPEPPLNN